MGIRPATMAGRPARPARKRIPAAVCFRDALLQRRGLRGGPSGRLGDRAADGCRDCVVEGNRVFDVSAAGSWSAGRRSKPACPAAAVPTTYSPAAHEFYARWHLLLRPGDPGGPIRPRPAVQRISIG